MKDKMIPLEMVLDALFTDYMERVPDVARIVDALIQRKIIKRSEDIVNDHIAFRTLGAPNLGIQSLERIFVRLGYQKRDYYYFPEKKLDAYWYAPPKEDLPRIFISELRVGELSSTTQDILSVYLKEVPDEPDFGYDFDKVSDTLDFIKKPLWEKPTSIDYYQLSQESEYAAWVICNRYYLNHYTMSVHAFKEPYHTLAYFNGFLEDVGIVLNDSGGKIKTSKDGLLKQSSSVASMVDYYFADGVCMKVPGSYVEFAERLPVPSGDTSKIVRREGFEADNADKIFESTYESQRRDRAD